MNAIKIALVAAFTITASASLVQAKDAPGKCGVNKFFDVKTKKCASKV
jgi:hypothetical protein